MTDRERIDWENLQPLPRRKRADGATRDDLAARKFNMGKAKHKGRNHLSNQKRRHISKEQAEQAKVRADQKLGLYRALKARVRAFWLGELDEHP